MHITPLTEHIKHMKIKLYRRLAGMLGLDALTDSLVASLAAATGVQNPSPEGSAWEAKELAALSTLVGLASGEEAGFLGSGWVTVLRTLSALDLLKVIHFAPRILQPPPPPPKCASDSRSTSRGGGGGP